MAQRDLILEFEGVTALIRDEFITVRVYAVWQREDGGFHKVNCGMVVMYHHVFAALALRPTAGDLVAIEVTMTEGTVEEYLESVIGTAA